MVLISCATFLFALLSATKAYEGVSHSLPNVHQTKTAEMYKKFTQHLSALNGKNTERDLVNPNDCATHSSQASLKFMTARVSIKNAANSNREALKLLTSLFGEHCLPCTMLQNALSKMTTGSETTVHVTWALTYETQSLSALLNSTKPWDPKYDVLATHLTRAVAWLLFAAEFPNKGNQDAALTLFDAELNQPETLKKALELADKWLTKIAPKLPKINMPPPPPTP